MTVIKVAAFLLLGEILWAAHLELPMITKIRNKATDVLAYLQLDLEYLECKFNSYLPQTHNLPSYALVAHPRTVLRVCNDSRYYCGYERYNHKVRETSIPESKLRLIFMRILFFGYWLGVYLCCSVGVGLCYDLGRTVCRIDQ